MFLHACSSTSSQQAQRASTFSELGAAPNSALTISGQPAGATLLGGNHFVASQPALSQSVLSAGGSLKTFSSKNRQFLQRTGNNQAGDYVFDPAQSFSVISYHRVGADKSPYTVSQESFAAQMRFLVESGYTAISLQQLLQHFEFSVPLPDKSILITVDDGHQSSYTEVFPVLQQYGFPAVFFPYGDYINNGGLTRKMIKEMSASGLAEFELHSKSHSSLTWRHEWETRDAYRQRIVDEITAPVAILEKLTGKRPTTLAYPYGKVDRVVERFVREVGLQAGFTVNCAKNTINTTRTKLNRCTIIASDTLQDFALKIEQPAKLLAASWQTDRRRDVPVASREEVTTLYADLDKPEFLGNVANRELIKNQPIEPFSGYFVDVGGTGLTYQVVGLPDGLAINNYSGLISGTPTREMSAARVRIVAIDKLGQKSQSNPFVITVY